MRQGPSQERVTSEADWQPIISSWLGGRVLADQLPVSGGRVTQTVTRGVQGKISFTVPRTDIYGGRTRRWSPAADPEHPLANNGQELLVSIMTGGVLARIGRFLITDFEVDGSAIRVDGAGMLRAVLDDTIIGNTAPRDNGTLRSEFDRILPPYMSATFDSSLVDRACPKAMEWDRDRLKTAYSIADAWPARLREDPWGGVRLLQPLPDVARPILTFTDGEGGTLISSPLSNSRDGAANVFVARSSAPGLDIEAVSRIESGPRAADGEYKRVVSEWASPLLDSQSAAQKAADTRRNESMRRTAVRKVTIAPDVRPELDDAVALVLSKGTAEERTEWGYVIGVELPLTVNDGPGRLDVAVVS